MGGGIPVIQYRNPETGEIVPNPNGRRHEAVDPDGDFTRHVELTRLDPGSRYEVEARAGGPDSCIR